MSEIKWESLEFEYRKKSFSWYLSTVLIGIVITLIAFWQKNLLLAIFIIIATIMVVYWAKQEPRTISYGLTDDHFIADDKAYELEGFSEFYIDNQLLVFKNKDLLSSYVKAMIDREDRDKIEDHLDHILPDFDYEEPLSEIVSRKIGF
jgi:hypothetical protein